MAKAKPPYPSRIQAKLLAAWERSELTQEEVLRRSGLKITPVSLGRKLKGLQILACHEVDILAPVLGARLCA